MYYSQLKIILQYGLVSILLSSATAMAGWQLEWIDDFDGSRVNKSNWTSQTQANYNAEVQCYTDDDTSPNKNYDVSNGTLKIISRKGAHSCTGLGGQTRSWTSGRINSKDKQEFLFGRIEARLRFNDLRGGTWPAFWMIENRINEQPFKGDNDFVGWPNPGAGEIDVWEWYSRGSNSYITNFFNTSNCGRETRYNYPGGAADVLQWHDYAMEWDQNSIKFFIDNTIVASHDISNCAQYKEPMFVLLNVAMGGTLGGAINPTLTTATMEVDYVAHCSASTANNVSSCNASTPRATFPQISSNPITSVLSNSAYNYRLIANDADGDNLTFSAPLLPSWLTFNSATGILSGIPRNANLGANAVALTVTDGTTVVPQNFTIIVTEAVIVEPQNNAPVITSTAITSITEGEIYSYTFAATDTDGDNLFKSASAIPSWLTFNSSTGVLTGIPSANVVGNHAVELRVNDGEIAIRQNFTITVTTAIIDPAPVEGEPVTPSNPSPVSGPNDVPFFTSTSTNVASPNSEYTYTLTASDPDEGELTMSAENLPAWLTFDNESGVLSGTPSTNDIGDHEITLVVTDGRATIKQNFVIEVTSSNTPAIEEPEADSPTSSSGGGQFGVMYLLMIFLIFLRKCKTLKKWGGVFFNQFIDIFAAKS